MRAGDVVGVDFGIPAGSEPDFMQPAVVATTGNILEAGPRTVHVVPITTNVTRSLPTECVGVRTRSSVAAQCHLCTVVSVMSLQPDDLGNVASFAASSTNNPRGPVGHSMRHGSSTFASNGGGVRCELNLLALAHDHGDEDADYHHYRTGGQSVMGLGAAG